jgi:hypothetical protein
MVYLDDTLMIDDRSPDMRFLFLLPLLGVFIFCAHLLKKHPSDFAHEAYTFYAQVLRSLFS